MVRQHVQRASIFAAEEQLDRPLRNFDLAQLTA